MSDSLKVRLHHLERSAYLYIRQSSMCQVIENAESTKPVRIAQPGYRTQLVRRSNCRGG